MARVSFPAVKDFSLLRSAQTDFGAHPASYSRGTVEDLSPGVKRQEREANHSLPSSAEFKKRGAIPPLPHVSMA
jgi:hypothetical protein